MPRLPASGISLIYHCDFLCVLALFSPLGHGFCSFFFLEHLERTRRYITRRDRGSSDNRGASYRHRKPPKLALFCGVPIPEKLEQAFAFLLFCGASTVCCVLQTYKQLRCTFGPSHVFSNEKASKRAVSNVWCKGVACMMAECFVGLQKV